MKRPHHLFLVFCCAAWLSCGAEFGVGVDDAGERFDASSDAGEFDSGSTRDSGAPPDAGVLRDAGARPDGGAIFDAGGQPDSGSRPDAGTGGTQYVRPSGGDDTTALINAVKANSKVIIDQPLIINGIVDLTGVSNKTIEWTGAGELKRTAAPSSGSIFVLLLHGVTNVHLVKPVISGAWSSCAYSAPVEHQHALQISGGSAYVTVDGGKFTNLPGDGVYIAGASHHVTINALTVSCVGRNAVSNVGSTVVRVNGGSFSNAGLWIFNIEPTGSKFVDDYRVETPTVGPSGSYWLLSTGPSFSCLVTNVTINKPVFNRPSKATNIQACVSAGITVNY